MNQIDRDTVIQWGREAAAKNGDTLKAEPSQNVVDLLMGVAQRAAEQEREACAQLCKNYSDEWCARSPRKQHHTGAGIGALACHDAIRKRGT